MVALRPVMPTISKRIDAKVGSDGIFWDGKIHAGITLKQTHIAMRGGRCGAITNMNPRFEDMLLEDVLVTHSKGASGHPLWSIRRHRLVNATTKRVRCVDHTRAAKVESGEARPNLWEHGIYDECEEGFFIYEDISGDNLPGQFHQIRLDKNDADPRINLQRHIEIRRGHANECGQKRGGGRLGFTYSYKNLGSNGALVARGLYSKNVEGVAPVKDNASGTYWSGGAFCAEFMDSLELTDFYFEHKAPDRPIIQTFEEIPSTHRVRRISGKHQIIADGELPRGGIIKVRLAPDVESVWVADNIRTGGPAEIVVQKLDTAGTQWKTQRYPLSKGFRFTA